MPRGWFLDLQRNRETVASFPYIGVCINAGAWQTFNAVALYER